MGWLFVLLGLCSTKNEYSDNHRILKSFYPFPGSKLFKNLSSFSSSDKISFCCRLCCHFRRERLAKSGRSNFLPLSSTSWNFDNSLNVLRMIVEKRFLWNSAVQHSKEWNVWDGLGSLCFAFFSSRQESLENAWDSYPATHFNQSKQQESQSLLVGTFSLN